MEGIAGTFFAVLADTLGKSRQELEAALTVSNDDGELTLKSDDDIKSYVGSLWKEKVKAVSGTKAQQFLAKGRKEAFEEVEASLGELGIDQFETWRDALPKLIDTGKSQAQTNPKDVRNSEVYINDVKALKEKLQTAEQKAQQVADEYAAKFTNRVAKSKVIDILKKEENGFVLPASETIFTTRLNNLLSALNEVEVNGQKTPVKLIADGDDVKVLNQDGSPVLDDDFNELTFEKLAKKTAETRFFETKQPGDRQSPGAPRHGDKKPELKGKAGRVIELSDKTALEIPTDVKDKTTFNSWYLQNRANLSTEAQTKAREFAKKEFSEQQN